MARFGLSRIRRASGARYADGSGPLHPVSGRGGRLPGNARWQAYRPGPRSAGRPKACRWPHRASRDCARGCPRFRESGRGDRACTLLLILRVGSAQHNLADLKRATKSLSYLKMPGNSRGFTIYQGKPHISSLMHVRNIVSAGILIACHTEKCSCGWV